MLGEPGCWGSPVSKFLSYLLQLYTSTHGAFWKHPRGFLETSTGNKESAFWAVRSFKPRSGRKLGSRRVKACTSPLLEGTKVWRGGGPQIPPNCWWEHSFPTSADVAWILLCPLRATQPAACTLVPLTRFYPGLPISTLAQLTSELQPASSAL